MTITRIVISILFIIAVLSLYILPRGLVNNGNDNLSAKDLADKNIPDSIQLSLVDSHKNVMSEELTGTINSLKVRISHANQNETVALIDSISGLFKSADQFDSAAIYYEKILSQSSDIKHVAKLADLYYEAYSFAMNRDKASYLGGKARQYYTTVFEMDTNRLDIKNKIAMTFVSSSNPMRGISMLQEIIKQDPENEEAIFNMGLLSLQSGQYEKAIERFEQLTKINIENLQGQFYLGLCYFELGDKKKARDQFELVKSKSNDPAILSTVENYLNELN